MNKFLENLLLSVTRPKKLFSILSEKPNLNNVILFALTLGFVYGLQLINDQTVAAFFQKMKNKPSLPGLVFYAVTYVLLFIMQTGFQVFLNVVCVKIVFYFLHIKSSVKVLVTVLTFTLTPLLIRNFIHALWQGYEGALGFEGQRKIYYFKTSLAQLVANSNFTNKLSFSLLSEFEIFAIWSFVLGAFAIAAVGKISYKTSTLIMLFAWVVSTLVFLVSI